MESLRTTLGLAVALVVVALLVRVPVSDVDLGREEPTQPPTPQPSPTEADPPDDTSGTARLVAVQPLDPVTLDARTDDPVALLQEPVVAISTVDTALLVELDQTPGGEAEVLRVAAPPTVATRWAQIDVDPHPMRTWLGGNRSVVAWATTDGRLQVHRAGVDATATTIPLPRGRLVHDGAFIAGGRLALLLRPPGPTASMSLLVVEVETLERLIDRTLTGFADPFTRGGPGWLHAWDPEARELHLLDLATGTVVAVDLHSGIRRERVLAAPPGAPPAAGLVAGGGRAVIYGVSGVTVLDTELEPVATSSDLAATDVRMARDGSLLVQLAEGGFAVTDADLDLVGLPVMPGPPVELLGVDDATGYVALHPDAPHQWLLAVDLPTATTTASVKVSAEARFSPAGALLLSPDAG